MLNIFKYKTKESYESYLETLNKEEAKAELINCENLSDKMRIFRRKFEYELDINYVYKLKRIIYDEKCERKNLQILLNNLSIYILELEKTVNLLYDENLVIEDFDRLKTNFYHSEDTREYYCKQMLCMYEEIFGNNNKEGTYYKLNNFIIEFKNNISKWVEEIYKQNCIFEDLATNICNGIIEIIAERLDLYFDSDKLFKEILDEELFTELSIKGYIYPLGFIEKYHSIGICYEDFHVAFLNKKMTVADDPNIDFIVVVYFSNNDLNQLGEFEKYLNKMIEKYTDTIDYLYTVIGYEKNEAINMYFKNDESKNNIQLTDDQIAKKLKKVTDNKYRGFFEFDD